MLQPVSEAATCPACGQSCARGADNPWRPFCSQRCRLTDLGQWFAERYRIPADGGAPDDADQAPGAEPSASPRRQ